MYLAVYVIFIYSDSARGSKFPSPPQRNSWKRNFPVNLKTFMGTVWSPELLKRESHSHQDDDFSRGAKDSVLQFELTENTGKAQGASLNLAPDENSAWHRTAGQVNESLSTLSVRWGWTCLNFHNAWEFWFMILVFFIPLPACCWGKSSLVNLHSLAKEEGGLLMAPSLMRSNLISFSICWATISSNCNWTVKTVGILK